MALPTSIFRGSGQITAVTNWAGDEKGNPLLKNAAFKPDTSIVKQTNLTIAEKVATLKKGMAEAFALTSTSPLIDAGTFVSGYHCARADDAASNPMRNPPADNSCRHWSGKAPDIGAFEYSSAVNPSAAPTPPDLQVQ